MLRGAFGVTLFGFLMTPAFLHVIRGLVRRRPPARSPSWPMGRPSHTGCRRIPRMRSASSCPTLGWRRILGRDDEPLRLDLKSTRWLESSNAVILERRPWERLEAF